MWLQFTTHGWAAISNVQVVVVVVMVVTVGGCHGYWCCSGQSAAVAELKLLVTAAQLDTYGVDPHPVKVLTHHWSSSAAASSSIIIITAAAADIHPHTLISISVSRHRFRSAKLAPGPISSAWSGDLKAPSMVTNRRHLTAVRLNCRLLTVWCL